MRGSLIRIIEIALGIALGLPLADVVTRLWHALFR